jgi:hypothetical protein
MTTDKSHSRFQHVYAIVRIDLPVDQQCPTNTLSVVKVFASKMAAEQEVLRLREVNKDKSCRYEVFVSRLVP